MDSRHLLEHTGLDNTSGSSILPRALFYSSISIDTFTHVRHHAVYMTARNHTCVLFLAHLFMRRGKIDRTSKALIGVSPRPAEIVYLTHETVVLVSLSWYANTEHQSSLTHGTVHSSSQRLVSKLSSQQGYSPFTSIPCPIG